VCYFAFTIRLSSTYPGRDYLSCTTVSVDDLLLCLQLLKSPLEPVTWQLLHEIRNPAFLIIKPTRCTNFSNLFWNETTCFGQFLCPSSGVIHCTLSSGICHTDSFRPGSGWNAVPSWSCLKAVYKAVWHIPLLMHGHMNVEFHHLLGWTLGFKTVGVPIE
jgi:hypothetical protein